MGWRVDAHQRHDLGACLLLRFSIWLCVSLLVQATFLCFVQMHFGLDFQGG
jgi:hypothetical protein